MIYILLILLLLFPSCVKEKKQVDNTQIVLRYADNQNADFPTTKAAIYFANRVYERTNGEIKILVYPDAKLGTEFEVLDQMMFGGIDFARFSLGTYSSFNKDFEVLTLPFLYQDSEHMWRVLDGEVGELFLKKTESEPIIGLSWFDAGARNFYTIKEFKSLKEFEGLKIRVQESELMESVVNAIGANGIKIPYNDVYSSLQTYKIDGAENNMPSYVSMDHAKVAQYVLKDEHLRIPELQMISKKTYERLYKLNPEYVKIIRECATESALYERELWKRAEEDALEMALKNGVKINELSSEERAIYKSKCMHLYENRSEEEQLILKKIETLIQ